MLNSATIRVAHHIFLQIMQLSDELDAGVHLQAQVLAICVPRKGIVCSSLSYGVTFRSDKCNDLGDSDSGY